MSSTATSRRPLARGLACFAFSLALAGATAPAQVEALAQRYGTGCAGASTGLVPQMNVTMLPVLGTPNFAFLLRDARAFTPCALFVGPRQDLDLGCTIHVGPGIALNFFTDGAGTLRVACSVPADPAALGFTAEAQWAVLDLGSQLLDAFCVSNAIHLRVGTCPTC